ncbi:MAG: hypothetical protein ABR530_09090 [Pyrinomonadaceae bacterium]
MNSTFVDVVEDVKQLTVEEQEHLRDLIDSYLVEARRDEILNNYRISRSEHLESSDDIERLKELLDA